MRGIHTAADGPQGSERCVLRHRGYWETDRAQAKHEAIRNALLAYDLSLPAATR